MSICLKAVLRYKFLILDTYQPDTLFTWARMWISVIIFRSQKESAGKKFGKHWSRLWAGFDSRQGWRFFTE